MRIAIVGCGVSGSYLLNRLPPEHDVEAFEMREADKWWAVCAWGTSAPFISDLVEKAGLNFEDYILFRGKRMIVDPGNGNTFDIKLNGLVTFDKTRLFGSALLVIPYAVLAIIGIVYLGERLVGF